MLKKETSQRKLGHCLLSWFLIHLRYRYRPSRQGRKWYLKKEIQSSDSLFGIKDLIYWKKKYLYILSGEFIGEFTV